MKKLFSFLVWAIVLLLTVNSWAADTKISDMISKDIPVVADTTVIVDSVGGANKKITLGNIPLTGNIELKALSTGVLKNTTTSGTPSIATAGTDYVAPKGTTSSASGPVTVTTANNRMTYVATAAVTYNLPTGDLSAYVATGIDPLRYAFCNLAAATLTVDPGAGNYISSGGAGKTLTNTAASELRGVATLQLVDSTASVNKWVMLGGDSTWVLTP